MATKKITMVPHGIPDAQSLILDVQDNEIFTRIKLKVQAKWSSVPMEWLIFLQDGRKPIKELDRVQQLALKNGSQIDVYTIQMLLNGELLQPSNIMSPNQSQKSSNIQNEPEERGYASQEVDELNQQIKQMRQDRLGEIQRTNQDRALLNLKITELETQIAHLNKLLEENRNFIDLKASQEEMLKQAHLKKFKEFSEDLIMCRKELQCSLNEKQELKERLQETTLELKYIKKDNQQLNEELQTAKSSQQQIQPPSGIRDNEIIRLGKQIEQDNMIKEKMEEKIRILSHSKSELEMKHTELDRRIMQQRNDFENIILEKETTQKLLETKLEQCKNELRVLNKDYSQTKMDLGTTQSQLANFQFNNQQLEEKLKQLMEQLDILNNEAEQKRKDLIKIKDEKGQVMDKQSTIENQLNAQIQQQNLKITRLQKEIQQLKQENSDKDDNNMKLQMQIQQMQAQGKEVVAKYESLIETLNKEKQSDEAKQEIIKKQKQQILLKFRNQFTKQNKDGRIDSPIQILYQANQSINGQFNSENMMSDAFQGTFQKIIIKKDQFTRILTKASDLNFNQAIELGASENWSGKKSLNPNGQGTKRQVFLLQVELPGNAMFVLKQLNQVDQMQSQEQVINFALNSLIGKYLLELYFEKLSKCIDQKLPNLMYQDQYLVNDSGKYYIAEQVQDGKFVKFNGNGESHDKPLQFTQLLNGFSLFTYYATQKQMMLSNIQGVNNILYDPIISTEDGIFNDEDQGQDEIVLMTSKAKEDPKLYGRQYLSALSIKL